MLIKFLLSAFDISAKLYPPQEQQESPSLQRGAHSVTCNYGIYCGVKRCLGCTCLPRALHAAPQGQPLFLALAPSKGTGAEPAHLPALGGRGTLVRSRCQPGAPPRPNPSRPRPQTAPAHPESLLDALVKHGLFNEKIERPEPLWLLVPGRVFSFPVSLYRISLCLAGATPPSGPFIPSVAWILLKEI